MTSSEPCFSTTLSVIITIRPLDDPGADWQPFDTGPGYFRFEPGYEARVHIHNSGNSDLAQLVSDLDGCKQVTFLDLTENRKITDSGLPRLKALDHLTQLSLSACDISDGGLVHLQPLDRLESLDLSYCNRLTDKGLRALEKLRHLKKLNLQGCVKITHAGVARLDRPGLEIHKPSRGQKTRSGDR